MKILITGIAGAGKSTIINELKKRGKTAIDLHDVPDLFFWQDRNTKRRVSYEPVKDKDWFETVDRVCDLEKLETLLNKYDDVVAAGTISSEDQKDFLSFFDKVILLQSNPDTLSLRLQTRNNKSGYGKTKAEREDNLEWQKEFDSLLLSCGAVSINTEGDLNEVVDEVIRFYCKF